MVAAAAQAAEPPVPGAPNPWRLAAPVSVAPEWTVEPERDERQDDGRARRRVERGPDRARPAGHDAQPSVFQAFVQQATGRLLPVFGQAFFERAPAHAPPTDTIPVSADYALAAGDEILLRVWGSIDADLRVRVDRDGMVHLPRVGSFNVAGVRAAELERHLQRQIGRLYRGFRLSATLGRLHAVKVSVVGPARYPGIYTLPSQATLLTALAAAGGPGTGGSMRHVLLRRAGRVVADWDLYGFFVGGERSEDIQLVDGDAVVVQPLGRTVALLGAVDTPAIYELRDEDDTIRSLLRYAGGASVVADPAFAQVERIEPRKPGAQRSTQLTRLDGPALDQRLADGDVLTLKPISQAFANAVTLKGHVAQPMRYPYRPGMRVRDLIPDTEFLVTESFHRLRNGLVQVRAPEAPAEANANARSALRASHDTVKAASPTGLPPGGAGRPDRVEEGTAQRIPEPLFDDLNWDYATIERLDERTLSTRVIAFDLGAVVLRGDAANNLELLPGDVVTVYGQKDIRGPKDARTRLVTVEGEVGAAGVYQLRPGEGLRALLERAGGLTPEAYLYGIELARESVRERQRANLADAIARLESLSATQSARDAANRRDDGPPGAVSAASGAATQAQLARLQRLRPNGRIALETMANAKALEGVPDIALDAGDRIVVPARPGFVTVIGAVANENALLWREGRTVGDYLTLAGLEDAADVSKLIVLHADGTAAAAARSSWIGGWGGVSDSVLQPGDSVIVPSQLDYETWGRVLARNLKDWSQIFSQFGLGAAAIKSLRK